MRGEGKAEGGKTQGARKEGGGDLRFEIDDFGFWIGRDLAIAGVGILSWDAAV
jgi:hypothetical protein